MAENKLPSGVGKKIVQALKKQAEIEIQPIPDKVQESTPLVKNLVKQETEPTTEVYQAGITDNVNLNDSFSDFSLTENNEEEPQYSDFNETNINDNFEEQLQPLGFGDNFSSGLNFEETEIPMFEEKEIFNKPQGVPAVPPQKNYAMPANVAVLKRLIMQLPQGVTKQTGAQIIRQTMEALGISMNSVLKEAQQGQDSLTASAKACMSTIAEYKNNIKTLEKQVQDYKKQAIALNDLISLFVMTDKH